MENKSEEKKAMPCNPAQSHCKHVNDMTGKLICMASKVPTCLIPALLPAKKSDFHSEEMIEATNSINQILADIPAHPTARLSILKLPQGLMLGWVEHGGAKVEGGITYDSNPDLVAKHYNLI